ncbi:hypothetical protein ACE1TH_06320 [Shouchella sp. JSM 1781072]
MKKRVFLIMTVLALSLSTLSTNFADAEDPIQTRGKTDIGQS